MALKSKINSQVPSSELIVFLISTFLFTNMQGMVGNYRQAYLVNVLKLDSDSLAFLNLICSTICFVLSFFYTMVIDRAPKPGKAKFKPLVGVAIFPAAVFTVLMFVTPKGLPPAMTIAYLTIVGVLHAASTHFAGTINDVGVVMSQNNVERDKILSLRGISNAIGNSAPPCGCFGHQGHRAHKHRGVSIYNLRRPLRPCLLYKHGLWP